MATNNAAKFAWRYPDLGDPKPRVDQEVWLLKADRTQGRGKWTDDCKAWCQLHANARKKEAA